jgi:hypothetical protein
MPVLARGVRGKPALIAMRYLGAPSVAYPTAVTIEVAVGGAAIGATTLPVTALPVDVPANTVLVFNKGTVDETTIVVTADANETDTSLSVDNYEGEEGQGLTTALTAGDEASWDTLLTFAGVEDTTTSANEQTNELSATTYGSGSGVRVSLPEVIAYSPTINVSGLFTDDNPLLKDLLRFGRGSNARWAVRKEIPKEDGLLWYLERARAMVLNVSEPVPAGDFARLSFDIRYVEKPTIEFSDDPTGS